MLVKKLFIFISLRQVDDGKTEGAGFFPYYVIQEVELFL